MTTTTDQAASTRKSSQAKITGALESTELTGKRPSKLSNDELVRLLRLFIERRGYGFSSTSPCSLRIIAC
ncbi:hypothetical protein GUJ93_ZPchr0013g37612 [Zizania palustris]|uniref:Uncharacterized protein n=1 Tax=Zizania palustris TaxID=103762 RepID=A0A8J6BY11_ZIZPA|nr:hypothetical protein GUJ93_ZPchr0013g37612 [Zizania palustris]